MIPASGGVGIAAPRRQPLVLRSLLLLAILTAVCLSDGSGSQASRIRRAAAPFAFNLLDWEVRQVGPRLGGLVQALRGEQPAADEGDLAAIQAYFRAAPGARAGLRSATEGAIQRLMAQAWQAERLASPSALRGGAPILFPPVSFTFADPPRVLIVSPRDRIAVSRYVLLRPSLGPDDVVLLEDGPARRGVSTLVTPIGGLATYPAMVLGGGSAEATLAAVAHEWVHAYFFFHPVGRGYWSSQELRTVNETAAELAGNELGARLASQLGFPLDPSRTDPSRPANPRQAELNGLLRQTRLEVDHLLALGQVAEAEQYMEQRRLEINARGFPLRRLNQAYFAFHGSYAEGPAGSSPIAGQVRRLRNASASLGEFVQRVAEVSSAEAVAGQ